MKVTLEDIWPKPKSFDEKMKEGASVQDGLAGSMKIERGIECREYPEFFKKSHRPIGGDDV